MPWEVYEAHRGREWEEREKERGREREREREDTEAAGLCVQMCRSAAGRREARSMLAGGSRHREDPRNERTGPTPLCSDRVR